MTLAFLEALLGAPRPVIMEVKRQDGHGNDLFGGRSVAEIVATYEAAGAPCISVVTGRWFGGATDLLREVAGLTDLPLLQKDFITRKTQLIDAVDGGAAAVLLTAAVLPGTTLRKLIAASLALGLTPFVEVTNEAEIESLSDAEHCVVAINNKNIKARETGPPSIERSLALLPSVLRTGTRCPVSASGVDRPDVAAALLEAGFAALLIGTGLLRAANVQGWLDELDRWRAGM